MLTRPVIQSVLRQNAATITDLHLFIKTAKENIGKAKADADNANHPRLLKWAHESLNFNRRHLKADRKRLMAMVVMQKDLKKQLHSMHLDALIVHAGEWTGVTYGMGA